MDQITELNQKIDLLTQQVGYLAEQARAAQLSRENGSELMRDLAPVTRGVMDSATRHFQDIEEYVEIADLVRILKKVARHLPKLEMLLDNLDGVTDLLEVAGPITKDVYNKAETTLDDMDRKGYFRFARGGMQIMDNIVTSFSEDEVRALGDNIVLILRTVKDMTQPEIMNFARNTVATAEQEAAGPVDTSYGAILKQMRDPNMRRGLAVAMKVLSGIGAQNKN
ncbi:MAG TPA: DUF1641 domain-containing protein [Thermoflexales bacterium]|nr:DUF1641 domain-containing protein [Thermoflexales bacterium]HQW35594.1 DUF1641 domain-containing protein [Thermoflexales bacterium]HQX75966.1 DUF1641 domain-containing protein [Thermoflexales bacterium]HQZ22191.1 DUF1641 domain-containing protein [Thermoflexales bacterium]HQZ98612.1 DUF1641 domain-containing protein [Thermoflexales bacterium]